MLGLRYMPLDTVKLRSPPLDKEQMARIERSCVRKQAIQVLSGAMLYEITSGSLQASWDSRIALRPMHEDWIKDAQGRVSLHPCAPYLILECSTAKVLYGQNVYGGPTRFQETCQRVIDVIEHLLEIPLPPAGKWQVRRADWAESFALSFPAIQEFFETLQTTYFPRRKVQKYGDHAIYIPGRTTTLKLYHKGPEFAEHDRKRITSSLLLNASNHSQPQVAKEAYVRRQVRALMRLANRRLRVEVEIHADKLDFDFGNKPTVDDVTEKYLVGVFDYEIERFLREGKDSMSLARTNREVASRLRNVYGQTAGNRLHGFWCRLATSGEAACRREYPAATFYRNRKWLQDAGVSWHNTDIQIAVTQGPLPGDFAPVRADPRRCISTVRQAHIPIARGFPSSCLATA